MFLLAMRNLATRWSRTLTAILGIGLAIAMAYVMSGVTEAFESESGRTLRALGTSFLIPEGSSGLLNNLIEASESPEGSVPVLFARDSLPAKGLDLNLFGTEVGVVKPVVGRAIERSGEAVADVSVGVDIGSRLTLVNQEFEVVGHTDGTRMFAGGPVAYLHIEDLRELYFNGRPVAQFFASSKPLEPPEGLEAMSFVDAKSDVDRAVRGAISSLSLTRTLLWLMVAGVVFILNRLSLLDRWSELATLKCLGANSLVVGSSLVIESVLVGALGAVVGCLGGLGLAQLFPLAVESSLLTAQRIGLLAVGVALLAALTGTLRLRLVSPGDAFRGEI